MIKTINVFKIILILSTMNLFSMENNNVQEIEVYEETETYKEHDIFNALYRQFVISVNAFKGGYAFLYNKWLEDNENRKFYELYRAVSQDKACKARDILNSLSPKERKNILERSGLLSDKLLSCYQDPLILKLCIAAGADVNACDSQKRTALHEQVLYHSYDTTITQVLLENNARTDLQDVIGRIPLHYSLDKILNHQAKFLIVYGNLKDIFVKDNCGIDCFSWAEKTLKEPYMGGGPILGYLETKNRGNAHCILKAFECEKLRKLTLKRNFTDEDMDIIFDKDCNETTLSQIKAPVNIVHGLRSREIGATKKDLMRLAIRN